MVPINLIAKPKEVKYGHFSKIHSGIPTVRARQTQWGLSSTCSSKNSCSVRDIFKQALAPKQLYADRLNFAPEEIPLSRPVKAGQEKKDASQSNYVPALKELRLIREWSIIPKSVLRKFVPTFRAPNDSRARAGCDGKNLFATSERGVTTREIPVRQRDPCVLRRHLVHPSDAAFGTLPRRTSRRLF